MSAIIVRNSAPVALWGGADVAPDVSRLLQARAGCHVAADGGANHLLQAGVRPLAVIGDLDSATSAAQTAFAAQLHPCQDQNTTDFEKAVAAIDAPLILAAGFLGGRLDHTMAVLNAMTRGAMRHIILLSGDDVVFLARKTCTRLDLPIGTRVGLLPSAARVDTRGLKWDIQDAAMAADGFISTSNETAQTAVEIYCIGMLFVTLPLQMLDAAIAAVRAG